MTRRSFSYLLTLAALLSSTAALHARPAHRKALADFLGAELATKLNDCRTCHLPDPPGAKPDSEEKPHNVFGARLAAVRAELRKAGKDTDLVTRVQAIADEDTDRDGTSNILELLSGHFPGDEKDRPDAAGLAAAKAKLTQRLARKDGYSWRPFARVVRPEPPQVKNTGWVRNSLDAFIAAEHEARGLKPQPEAPRHVLLRRVYLDLIGLPPTSAEVKAFVEDKALDAYEKVVDRLLASPHHGERWGRHWMDVWRYSDWAGYGAEVRDSQPHIWRWRDWIVESLNADKGYDRMVQEMLAGDELAPDDLDTLRATGFLVRNWYKFNRNVWLDRAVEHTSKAFLGLTLNCARCHDHFFDPVSQKEYYQFRAFFEPHDIRTDRVPGQPNPLVNGLVRVYDAKPDAPTYLFIRGEDSQPDKKKPLPPGVPSCLSGPELKIAAVQLPAAAVVPDKRAFVVRELREAAVQEVERRLTERAASQQRSLAGVAGLLARPVFPTLVGWPAVLQATAATELAEAELRNAQAQLASLGAVLLVEGLEDSGKKSSPEWTKAAQEAARSQRQAAITVARRDLLLAEQQTQAAAPAARAAAEKKLAATKAALVKAEQAEKQPLTAAYAPRIKGSYPATSTGRRLALAQWLTSKDNPLTARVAVNHIWLRHLGEPLVPSVFDFGNNGKAPSHPALLDWLAAELMERGWSMKHLHRLIVTSATYRLASTHDAASARSDGDNRYLWRMNSRRMEAEIVRDSVLAVSGQLDRKMGGVEQDHNAALTVWRRSLYFRHAPEKEVEFLKLFDSANFNECYRRNESVVPQQALALSNSTLVLAQSRLLARKLVKDVGEKDVSGFVRAAFECVLGRAPTSEEQATCAQFLTRQAELLAGKKLTPFDAGPASIVPPALEPQLRARESLIHVLFNHNEFVTIR